MDTRAAGNKVAGKVAGQCSAAAGLAPDMDSKAASTAVGTIDTGSVGPRRMVGRPRLLRRTVDKTAHLENRHYRSYDNSLIPYFLEGRTELAGWARLRGLWGIAKTLMLSLLLSRLLGGILGRLSGVIFFDYSAIRCR